MGQTEVAAVFEDNPFKSFTVKEVAKITGRNVETVRRCIHKLNWMLDIKEEKTSTSNRLSIRLKYKI